MSNETYQGSFRPSNRQVSRSMVEDLSAIGIVRRAKFDLVLRIISQNLRLDSSPTKAIRKSVVNIENFLKEKDVRGSIVGRGQRKISFKLSIPFRADDLLGFCFIKGDLNGRTGAILISESTSLKVTAHALQRLIERVDVNDNNAVLDEVHACLEWAPFWNSAGVKIKAQCWPILSSNGFFVAIQSDNPSLAVALTWMQKETLSKKWGDVYDNLSWIGTHRKDLMTNEQFIMEFIGSFPWLLREHTPKEDLTSVAWERRRIERLHEDTLDSSFVSNIYSESKPDDSGHFTNKDCASNFKSSVSYVPGFNYHALAPELRVYSRHIGMIIHKQRSGNVVVSLKNSWYGVLPGDSNRKTDFLMPGTVEENVGDFIEVEVKKVALIESELAYAVYLIRAEFVDAICKYITDLYPVGANTVQTIFSVMNDNCVIKLSNGFRGFVQFNQVSWFLNKSPSFTGNVVGNAVDLIVSEHRLSSRTLIFDVSGYKEYFTTVIYKKYQVGCNVSGIVVYKFGSFVSLKLDDGISMILNHVNCWGAPLPEVGNKVLARIIHAENEILYVGLHAPQGVSEEYYSIFTSDERWKIFELTYSLNQQVKVQVLSSQATGYFVSMSDGYGGLLGFNDISWSKDKENQKLIVKIGDILDVIISKISSKKKFIYFSRKRLIPSPWDVSGSSLRLNDKVSGVVVSALDYGYFINLPSEIVGLLHINNNPDKLTFEIGDTITVNVIDIDLEGERLSLSLTPLEKH